MKKRFICKENDISNNETRSFPGPGGKDAILMKVNGELRAYVNSCPHMGGSIMLEGCKEGGICVLRCQWHGASFNALNGEVLSGPPPSGSSLRELPLIIEGNNIYYQ